MENIGEELKDRVIRLRKEAGLTQVALANLSKLSTKMIKDIEKGRRRGSVDTLSALAKAFGIKLEELIGDEEVSPSVKKVEVFKMSKMLSRLEGVPDKVYELAMKLGRNNPVWEDEIIPLLEAAVEDEELARQKKSQRA